MQSKSVSANLYKSFLILQYLPVWKNSCFSRKYRVIAIIAWTMQCLYYKSASLREGMLNGKGLILEIQNMHLKCIDAQLQVASLFGKKECVYATVNSHCLVLVSKYGINLSSMLNIKRNEIWKWIIVHPYYSMQITLHITLAFLFPIVALSSFLLKIVDWLNVG